jgi:hypothetical protein
VKALKPADPPAGLVPAIFKNGVGVEFVKVPKGTAWLGGGAGKPGVTKVVIEQDFYLGKWLRRSSGYPTWFGRLVRPHQVRVEREFNEEFLTEGTALHLREHLHHFPFNKGIAYWIERHNRYSNMEAAIVENIRDEALRPADLLSADPTVRRRALKRIAYRLPMRPWMVFFYLYIVRLGILDGRGGLEFSRMRATYEMLIDLKLMELERRKRGLPV